MSNIIDCRKLNCPEPVLRTKAALEQSPDNLITIVDNEAAKENVSRLARKLGYSVSSTEDSGAFRIIIERKEANPAVAEVELRKTASDEKAVKSQMLLIGSDQLGRGSEELGKLLMRSFIFTLTKGEQMPRALIFINAGVKLSTKDSPVLEELAQLSEVGVRILSCGTCLDYYQLKDELMVGEVTNMYDIAEHLSDADKVITL